MLLIVLQNVVAVFVYFTDCLFVFDLVLFFGLVFVLFCFALISKGMSGFTNDPLQTDFAHATGIKSSE